MSAVNGKFLALTTTVATLAAFAVVGSAVLLARANNTATVQLAVSKPAHASASARTGVVIIDTNLAYQYGGAAGTGIVLTSAGEVLTNNHVVRGATTIHVSDPSDGLTFSAKVLGYSISDDVALLQLQNPRGLTPAKLGNSSSVKIGWPITAVGNAGGTGSLTTVTGRITHLGQSITVSDDQGGTNRLTGMIETSASLEPGDSGGPLLYGGRVVGMDAAASRTGGENQFGDSYAIPISTTSSVVHQVLGGHTTSTVHVGPTAFLGVLLKRLGGNVQGAAIQDVIPGSAAAKAGIGRGDTIVRAGGHTIASAKDLQHVILQVAPGKPLGLSWVDGFGSTRNATVRPAAGPPQ
jgi:S1-C subfamily serine protease